MQKKEPNLQSLSSKIKSIASLTTEYSMPRSSILLGGGALFAIMAIVGLSSFAAPQVHRVSASLAKGQSAASVTDDAQDLSAIAPAAGEQFDAATAPQPANAAPQPQIKVATATARLTQKKIALGRGGTLIGALVHKAGVSGHDAYKALAALKKVYNPRDLRPKDDIAVLFERKSGAAVFQGMKVIARDGSTVTVARAGDDFRASVLKVHLHPVVREFSGRIGNSFYVSARRQGVPARVILGMVKMYGPSVDFKRGVRPSDHYKILYQEYARGNGAIDAAKGGDIIYADLLLGHQNMPLYRYKDSHGVVGYY
ncbi:MAG: hypothetical protein KGH84_04115, partial [Paracoccaceae bacterium]|nr:hypothetical protein [Paracoccaceae bacterium]